MGDFQVFDPRTEVRGNIVNMFFHNINYDEIAPVLADHKLNQIDPGTWYPFQGLLDIFSTLAHRVNGSENFVAVGMAVGEERVAVLPNEVWESSFFDLLTRYSKSYPTSYRNGDPGYVRVEQIDAANYLMHVCTPYPDDVFYGVLYSLARRHCQHQGRTFILRYADGVLRKDEGGRETVYHFTLE